MPSNPEPTMSRNNPWIFLFVVLIICWSLYEIYPPTSRSLVQAFETRAMDRDTNFTAIVQRLQPLLQAGTNSEFGNLQEAIGTNNITPYFPFFNAKNKLYPNTFILNQLQRDALGKIKLGLDLQGGTSFLVRMDTNRQFPAAPGFERRIGFRQPSPGNHRNCMMSTKPFPSRLRAPSRNVPLPVPRRKQNGRCTAPARSPGCQRWPSCWLDVHSAVHVEPPR